MKLAQQKHQQISLARQYATAMAALLSIALSVLALLMFYSQIKQSERYLRDFGGIITEQLANAASEPLFSGDKQALDNLIDNFSTDKHIAGIGVFNRNKTLISSKGKLPDYHNIKPELGHYRTGSRWWLFNTNQARQIVHIQSIDIGMLEMGYIVIAFSQEAFDKQFREQIYSIILIGCLFLLISVVASLYLGKRLSSPIRNLILAAESIRQGKQDIIFERRNDELASLIDSINNMSQGLIRKEQVENMLDKVLSKDVKQKVMEQFDTMDMRGEQVEATVLFADIVGFTSISEKMPPQEVQQLLNEYYGYFNACARFFFGTVDKYIGDCVMVVFGATQEDSEHEYHAVACALLMQQLAKQLNHRREQQGLFPIELRIGINTGKMVAGLIGSAERMEYTVVGDAVNLASRLCSEAAESQIIIEESTYQAINSKYPLTTNDVKKIHIRGKSQAVTIYNVLDIEQGKHVASQDLIDDILTSKVRRPFT